GEFSVDQLEAKAALSAFIGVLDGILAILPLYHYVKNKIPELDPNGCKKCEIDKKSTNDSLVPEPTKEGSKPDIQFEEGKDYYVNNNGVISALPNKRLAFQLLEILNKVNKETPQVTVLDANGNPRGYSFNIFYNPKPNGLGEFSFAPDFAKFIKFGVFVPQDCLQNSYIRIGTSDIVMGEGDNVGWNLDRANYEFSKLMQLPGLPEGAFGLHAGVVKASIEFALGRMTEKGEPIGGSPEAELKKLFLGNDNLCTVNKPDGTKVPDKGTDVPIDGDGAVVIPDKGTEVPIDDDNAVAAPIENAVPATDGL
ncbi:MAG: hypothetical protein HY072_08380, partial [Deltaproteobacteria bacterium]|nr:hypothetical protein [Deltaproteobacteria bacterium]